MGNPYHDGAGKFCSKGEMEKSIARLYEEGKTDEAFSLGLELHEIEKSKITPELPPIIGDQKWYLDGKLHREDGPAIIYADGREAYYVNGKLIASSIDGHWLFP